MTEEMTYEELAGHDDRIHHDKPYEQEAQTVVGLLRREGAREGRTLELFDEHGLDARVSDRSLTEERVLFVGRRRI